MKLNAPYNIYVRSPIIQQSNIFSVIPLSYRKF